MGTDALRAQLTGRVIDESDNEYDIAAAVWNGNIHRRSAVIARCTGPSDVAAAIAFARERELQISVRGGRHGYWEAAAPAGGLIIDLSELRGMSVDPGSRRAWCSGGATIADLDVATQRHGLAVTGGTISHTGVGGLTLGGGLGWLVHKAGLTVDNLLSAEVVTADGRIIGVSADEYPDLFWALRGGGGNFGVVTGFEFRLHEVGLGYLGLFFWGLEQGTEALRLGRDVATSLPRDAGLLLVAGLSAPAAPFVPARYRGKPGFALLLAGFGSAQQHAALIAPIRDALPPLFEFVTSLPYVELQKILDDSAPWGIHAYEKSLCLRELSDGAIAVLSEHIPLKRSPLSNVAIFTLGGAFAAVAEQDTAFGCSRAARFVVNLIAMAPDAELLASDRAWARSLWQALAPHSSDIGGYLNFMADDDPARVQAAYGSAKYERLARVKARYDPDNVFRINANIKPEPPRAGPSTMYRVGVNSPHGGAAAD
jgi:FAD/FMN-containing dehydrogenase